MLEDRDGAGPQAASIVASSTTPAVTLQLGLLHELLNAEYSVRVCDANRCGPASAVIRPDVTAAAGTLTAGTPGAHERFGESVAVSADGGTIAVGVPFENNVLSTDRQSGVPDSSGSVYVFTRAAAGWTQQAYLRSSRPGHDARFGMSVALSADGSTLAVGSGTDPALAIMGGSVDVFVRSAGTWSHQAYLLPSNPGAFYQFGTRISLSDDGNTLAVGAFTEYDPAVGPPPFNPMGTKPPVGAVYVFARSAGAWTQQAHIRHPQPTVSDFFGQALALSGDGNLLAIGAPNRRVAGGAFDAMGKGVVYVFQRAGTAWTQQAMLTASNAALTSLFGSAVALSTDGSTLAVAATGDSSGIPGNQTDTSAFGAGAVHVFVRSGSGWNQQAYLKAHNPENSDTFGSSLSLSGDGKTLAVGAAWEDGSARWFGSTSGTADNGTLNAGAAYVFQLGSAGWTETGYLKPGGANREFALFGQALALSRDGRTLAVGAPYDPTAAHIGGAVYLY